jgi:hypothetical protein
MYEKGHKAYNPAPKGNRLAVKHSLHVYRRILSGDRLDGRTSLHRVLREKERELIAALGGDPSPQERLIISDAVKTLLYVGTLDEYLMRLDGDLVRNGKVISVIETRTSLATHLRRDLESLGLKRVSKEVSLSDYIQERYGSDQKSNANETGQGGGTGIDHLPVNATNDGDSSNESS